MLYKSVASVANPERFFVSACEVGGEEKSGQNDEAADGELVEKIVVHMVRLRSPQVIKIMKNF